MYKKKLKEWNAFKNLRPLQVLEILRLKRARDAERKPSVFYVNGKKVEPSSLQNYISHNPSLLSRAHEPRDATIEAELHVECRSPSPSPDSGPVTDTIFCDLPIPDPSSPEEEEEEHVPSSPDQVLGPLQAYLDGCFAARLWSWSDRECWNTRGRRRPAHLLEALLVRCTTAASSVDKQAQPMAVRQALDASFSMLLRVLKNPPPGMIPALASAAMRLAQSRIEIGCLLLDFCADLAAVLYGHHHSLARFWLALGRSYAQGHTYVLEMVCVRCLQEFERHVGAANELTLWAFLQFFDAFERQKSPETQIANLQQRLVTVDGSQADVALVRSLQFELSLSTCKWKLEQSQLAQAERALLSTGQPGHLSPKEQSCRFMWLGYVQWLRGDLAVAERSYRYAVDAAKRLGRRDDLCEAFFELETFLSRVGSWIQAETIRAERLQLYAKFGTVICTSSSLTEEIPQASVTVVRIESGPGSESWLPHAFEEVMLCQGEA